MSSDVTFSDHRCVDFNITLMADVAAKAPDQAKANWQKFRECLSRLLFRDPKFITKP